VGNRIKWGEGFFEFGRALGVLRSQGDQDDQKKCMFRLTLRKVIVMAHWRSMALLAVDVIVERFLSSLYLIER
jgi:hypothetical protein